MGGAIPSLPIRVYGMVLLHRDIFTFENICFWAAMPCGYIYIDVSKELTTAAVTLMIEAASSSETSTCRYQTTRSHISEDVSSWSPLVRVIFFAYLSWTP
jgi:hypothetical protein